MEPIEDPQTCMVKKHVAGDTVTMVVIVSDLEQKLYHFVVPDEDTTVQDLLEQITDFVRPPLKVHLFTDPNSQYNYIVNTETEVEKNSVKNSDKRCVVESPVKTYNSSGSASSVRISSIPKQTQNESEEFEDRDNLKLSPLSDFCNTSEAKIDKKEETIAAETNEKEELLEDGFIMDNVRPPYTHLYCRVISIGTHYYVPKETVIMAASGAHFRVPHPKDDSNLVIVLLKSKAIAKVAYNFRESLPALFFYVEWHASLEISSLLGMQKGNGPYYDSLGKDYRTSLIAFVLESLSEESRNLLEVLFSKPNDLMIPIEEDDVENTLRHILTRKVWLNIKSSKKATSTDCNPVTHKLEPPVIKPQSSLDLSDGSMFKNRVGRERSGKIVETPEAEINALEKRKKTANNAGKLQTSVRETEMFEEPVALARNSIIENAEILLVYPPPPARGGITLSLRDDDSLREDRFLNDVIIDFYLQYLTHQVLSKEDENRTHVFSVHFYQRLTSSDPPPMKNDSFLSLERRRHANVKKWTKNMNIFEKDFIIVPINECAHWYLAIICYPGLVAKAGKSSPELERRPRKAKEARCEVVGTRNEKRIKKLPCILIFDSLNTSTKNGRSAMATLRDYLSCEHEAKLGTKVDFNDVTMKGDCPKVPQQSNYSDCGLYLLQYVEHFFNNPIRDYTLPLKTLEHWFDADVVNGKREKISKLIRKLSKRHNSH